MKKEKTPTLEDVLKVARTKDCDLLDRIAFWLQVKPGLREAMEQMTDQFRNEDFTNTEVLKKSKQR